MATKRKTKTKSARTAVAAPADAGTPAPRRAARKPRRAKVVLNVAGVAGGSRGARAQGLTVPDADVTDELAKGGPAFGSFLKAVGMAVADSQKALDATLVETAKALSETKIDVIAVYEQVLDDNDGSMKAGNAIVQNLPLVNYLMPTAYNFSRVYLQADMKVQEFNGASGMTISGSAKSLNASAKASYGLSGFGASGGVSYGQSSFNRSTDTAVAQDSAAGSLHMEATLEPRTDVELPRPFIVQKGPQLTASITKSEPILGTVPQGSATPAPTIGRKVTIEALLKMTNGSANNGKNLNVTVSEPQFNVAVTNPAATDNKTVIEISNNFGAQPAGTADPARKPAAVRISFGLVTQTVGITL